MFAALTSRVRTGHSFVESSPPRRTATGSRSPSPSSSVVRPRQKLRSKPLSSETLEPSNPDYLLQKHKLDHLAAFLGATLDSLTETMQAWTAVARQQSHFAALVAQAGTSASLARSKCARAARATAACAAEIESTAMKATVVPEAMEQLTLFLEHVQALQERYRDVRKMKREYDACAARLRATQAKLSSGGEAVARAQAKFDKGEEVYEGMVRRMAERMAEANRRTPEVVSTVHYLYWLLQERATTKLMESTEAEMSAANAAEPALCYVTFCKGLRSPSSVFRALEGSSESARRRR